MDWRIKSGYGDFVPERRWKLAVPGKTSAGSKIKSAVLISRSAQAPTFSLRFAGIFVRHADNQLILSKFEKCSQ
jgi:hypothetical protein